MGAASGGRASAAGTEGRRMARIMLESITKQFGSDVIAVDDVSLSTEDGEFMVLVGPSGCGKSTILRIVAGLEEVTAGEVYIGGGERTAPPPNKTIFPLGFRNFSRHSRISRGRRDSSRLMLR